MTQQSTPIKPAYKSKDDHPKLMGWEYLQNGTISPERFKGNIENLAGLCVLPIGIAGPLLINGADAQGEFHIPLATTEGALVASYNRGLKAGYLSGGFWARVVDEATQRCPLFKFANAGQSIAFANWVCDEIETLKAISARGSNHALLRSVKPLLEGNEVILDLTFTTGDASGQNMVTICSQRVCEYINEQSPVKAEVWYIEGNASGDKKVGSQSLIRTRGKKVIAEVTLSQKVVREVLKSTPDKMVKYWQSSSMAQVKTGTVGNQGHVANGLTAMFLATGQDVACITEAVQAINRMELNANGDLYASLTLPNLIVGTVGGGTGLPTQQECLEMMDCFGKGKAKKLAEIMTALALAGELSIAAAIAEGHFTSAHEQLGRK